MTNKMLKSNDKVTVVLYIVENGINEHVTVNRFICSLADIVTECKARSMRDDIQCHNTPSFYYRHAIMVAN